MPLLEGSSDEVIKANIAELVKAGHTQEQAAAIAYKKAGRAMDRRETDANGWVEHVGTPISKVGVFTYSGRAMGIQPENKMFNVLRPAEELSNPACIESFKLLPFVDEHPTEMLGDPSKNLTNPDQKGVRGVVGEKVFFDGSYLRGNVKVFSPNASKKIDNKEKVELSLGYSCRWCKESGTFEGQSYDFVQRDIRGNHVALVGAGRCGSDVAVMDGVDFIAVLDEKELSSMENNVVPAEKPDEKKAKDGEVTLSSVAEALAALTDKFTKMEAVINKLLPLEKKEHQELADGKGKDACKDEGKEAKKDAKPVADAAEIEAMRAELASIKAATAPQILAAKLAEKQKLYEGVSKTIGAFDASEMDAQGVAVYACKKLGLSVPAGQEQTAVTAYLAAKPAMDSATHKAATTPNVVAQYLGGVQ